MDLNTVFPIVKKHIDELDYYGLLAGGAPSDEFDGESKEISAKINVGQSALDIAEIIAEVFNSQFSENEAASTFLSVAEAIKKDLSL